MIEKDMDSEESAIIVEASSAAASAYVDHQGCNYPRTIGAAIQLLEAKLAEAGIILQLHVPSPKKQDHETESKNSKEPPKEEDKVRVSDVKLLVLPTIVMSGIKSAIDNGFGTRESVGRRTSSEKALVPGNVVALYCCGSFLRVYNDKVECGGGSRSRDQLPFDWDSERFLIVDAGHGEVAFYNIVYRIFLGIDKNGHATVSNENCSVTRLDDRPRGNESFLPVKASGYIELYCGALNKRLIYFGDNNNNSYIAFSFVQIHGFE
jgi:hypothetical protein